MIHFFIRNKIVTQIMLIVIVLSGIHALNQLPVQFFPNFKINLVSISAPWDGASPEDVESSVLQPIENSLKGLDGLELMRGKAMNGGASIILEFSPTTSMSDALDDIKARVDRLDDLPMQVEGPHVIRLINSEPVIRLFMKSEGRLLPVQRLAHQFKDQLLARDIDYVRLVGTYRPIIRIQVPLQSLWKHNISLTQLVNLIRSQQTSMPIGVVGDSYFQHY